LQGYSNSGGFKRSQLLLPATTVEDRRRSSTLIRQSSRKAKKVFLGFGELTEMTKPPKLAFGGFVIFKTRVFELLVAAGRAHF
jgi:hypothetical protein